MNKNEIAEAKTLIDSTLNGSPDLEVEAVFPEKLIGGCPRGCSRRSEFSGDLDICTKNTATGVCGHTRMCHGTVDGPQHVFSTEDQPHPTPPREDWSAKAELLGAHPSQDARVTRDMEWAKALEAVGCQVDDFDPIEISNVAAIRARSKVKGKR